MSANRKSIGSNLRKVDAHAVQATEYAEIPELHDAFFEQADHYVGEKLIKRGRPKSENPRRLLTLRLPPDVITRWKATGPGWQTRMAAALAKHAPRANSARQ